MCVLVRVWVWVWACVCINIHSCALKMLLVNEFHDYFSYLYISHVAGADAVEGGKCARVVEKLLVAPCYSSSLCVCVCVFVCVC